MGAGAVKVLLVHPGASWATHDVYMGVLEGLRANGVVVSEFRLDQRIDRSHDFLFYLYRQAKKQQPDKHWPKPTMGDVLYRASEGLVERAIEIGATDIVVISAMYVMAERLELARRIGLRVWLICTETPYAMADELRLAAAVDGAWTHERAVLPLFEQVQPATSYLPSAWRKGTHDAVEQDKTDPICDVLFIGSFFHERNCWLESIDWSGINLHLYGVTEMIPQGSSLLKFVQGGLVDNDRVVRLAKRAKIVINLFREDTDGHAAESLNPRIYEMAAAGIPQISTERAELCEKFGDAIPTFASALEAGVLIRALLADPDRRAAQAHRARQLVTDDHWTARAEQMINDITRWRAAAKE
jgi:hypothetical protein